MARNPSIGNPAPYALQAVVEGTSATEALEQIRAAGGGISTQNWYRAYGEAQASVAALQDMLGVDLTHVPEAAAFTEWAAGEGGQYAYQFTFAGRDIETGVPVQMPWTVLSDSPITPAEAMQQALSDAAEGQENQSGAVDIGAPTSMTLYQTVPYE